MGNHKKTKRQLPRRGWSLFASTGVDEVAGEVDGSEGLFEDRCEGGE